MLSSYFEFFYPVYHIDSCDVSFLARFVRSSLQRTHGRVQGFVMLANRPSGSHKCQYSLPIVHARPQGWQSSSSIVRESTSPSLENVANNSCVELLFALLRLSDVFMFFSVSFFVRLHGVWLMAVAGWATWNLAVDRWCTLAVLLMFSLFQAGRRVAVVYIWSCCHWWTWLWLLNDVEDNEQLWYG